jgi:hypothetical protein
VICGVCGAQTPEEIFICAECARRGDTRRDIPEAKTPVGVGGWLLLLCISLTILSPIRLVADFNSVRRQLAPHIAFEPAYRTLIFGCGVLNLSVAVGLFVAGSMLWWRRPRAVRAAKIALSYYVCSLGPMSILSYLAGLPPEIAKVWSVTILKTIPLAVVYPLIWFLYLSYSKRVRATYPAELERQVHSGSAM